MTDNEIINQWKHERELAECVCSYFVDQVELSLVNGTIDLINRQQSENKELAEAIHNLTIEKDALFDKAEELNKEIPNSVIAGQFVNPSNPKAHFETTGPEIWRDTDGDIDFYVATVGTGGTLSGAGEYLKEKNPNIKVVAVEPLASPLLSKGICGPHKIQGIGANFIPKTLNQEIYDEVIAVPDDKAFEIGSLAVKSDGIFIGISSGAALYAAIEIAKRKENKGKKIVVVLPDNGDRYLSTPLFN